MNGKLKRMTHTVLFAQSVVNGEICRGGNSMKAHNLKEI